jgi:hypothetical protein
MVLEIAPQPGMKKNPNTPHIARLEAIMDVLGYEGFGGQKRFADEIGVNYNDFKIKWPRAPALHDRCICDQKAVWD